MNGQFDSMTQGERMELRVRRMIGRDPVPVRLCVGRRNGKTELLRRAAELMVCLVFFPAMPLTSFRKEK